MVMNFFKGDPNSHVILFRNGKITKEGLGLNIWYAPMVSTIAIVPAVNTDAPFIFQETTFDFQEVAVQGVLTYRIADPSFIATQVDFSIDPKNGYYRSDDPEQIVSRIVTVVQDYARFHLAKLPLREALQSARNIAENVLQDIKEKGDLQNLGIEVTSLHITSLKATPEMQKALEAEYRERLQQEADIAIYARRATAVDEERKIQESELNTEVELENRRQELIEHKVQNQLALAEAEAKAEKMKLDPYTDLAPAVLISLALKEWSQSGGSIGNLSITPDMLSGLLGYLQNGSPKPIVES